MSDWRTPSERSELVERVCHLERRLRIYEAIARDWMNENDRTTWLMARVEELERIVAIQNQRQASSNSSRGGTR